METKLYLVHNGGEYSGYSVLGLFTEKDLAESFSKVADGVVEEWTANIPPEKWTTHSGTLNAKKENGKWEVEVSVRSGRPGMEPVSVETQLGNYTGWGEKDPKTNQYEYGYSKSIAQSEEQAKKMVIDDFWKVVAEIDS